MSTGRVWTRILLAATVAAVSARDILQDHFTVHRKILESQGYNDFNLTTLTKLFSLHDEDFTCGTSCERYLKATFTESSWEFFEKVIRALYEGQISLDPYYPQEIHLSLTEKPQAMRVGWATMQALENPFTEYISASSNDWSTAKSVPALNYTYRVEQKWWPIFEGVLYEADMTDLTAGSSYKYRVGGWDSANQTTRYSEVFDFKTAPEGEGPNRRTKIAFLADQGTFELLGFAVTRKMKAVQAELGFEMVMVGGDLSYAGLSSAMPALNISKEDEFEHIWDLLMIQNQLVAANVPWMVGPGNHERFYNWTSFTNRFHMPSSPDSVGNFWYSYNYGNSHWLSISSEHPLEEGSPQRAFIIKDLQAAVANRANVPWIVLVIHKPIYSSTSGAPSYANQLEDLLIQYDVDIALVGHMHAYERIHPVLKGEVTVKPVKGRTNEDRRMDVYYSTGKGPVHIVQGNTGGMQAERFDQPAPAWSAIRMANGYVVPSIPPHNLQGMDAVSSVQTHSLPFNYTDTYGFGMLDFVNSTHLYYHSIPITGEIGNDQFWIVKRV